MTLVVLVVSGCGAQPPVTPSDSTSGSPDPAASAAGGSPGASADEIAEAVKKAALAFDGQGVGNADVGPDMLATAMGLPESLGADAEHILALAAAAEDAARAKAPIRIDVPTAHVIVDAVARITPVILPKVPPPGSEVRDYLRDLTHSVGLPGPTTTHMGPTETTGEGSDAGQSGTVAMSTTVDAIINGSKVTIVFLREVHSTITDDASGTSIYEATKTYREVASIDVCPTAAGIADASVMDTVDVEAQSFAGAGGRVASHLTGNFTSASTFQGHVDDSASLTGVSQDYTHHQSWRRTASAPGGPESSHEGAFEFSAAGIQDGVPTSRESWALTPGDFSGATTTGDSSGDATAEMIGDTVVGTAADDFGTVDHAYVESQKLWRRGRCVVVSVPQYNAETPIDAGQDIAAHSEDVEKGSSTPFKVELKQRFASGTVTASIQAKLFSGKENVTPGTLPNAPGTLTYAAPDEDGKDALVSMVSTSKRGIGTLILEFHTGVTKLKVGIKGTMTTSGFGVSYVTAVTASAIVLSPEPDGTYSGSGRATATIKFAIDECPKPYVQKGTLKLRATREVVEDQQLERHWTVTWDPSTAFTTSGTCMGAPMDTFTGTGAGPIAGFMDVLGEVVFVQDGGTLHVQRMEAIGASTNTLDATVTAEVVGEAAP